MQTKLGGIFQIGWFCIDGNSIPYCLDKIVMYIREDTLKMMNLDPLQNSFLVFSIEINSTKWYHSCSKTSNEIILLIMKNSSDSSNSPVNVRFDSEKNYCWPIFGSVPLSPPWGKFLINNHLCLHQQYKHISSKMLHEDDSPLCEIIWWSGFFLNNFGFNCVVFANGNIFYMLTSAKT